MPQQNKLDRPFSGKRTRFIEFMGMQIKEVRSGRSRLCLAVAEEHLNPSGTVHGGVTFSLVDTSMGMALFAMLDENQMCVTAEIKIHYLAPIADGTITARSRVIKKGKRLGIIETNVSNEDDELVAKALGTYTILNKPLTT
jgi:uncharacterized protein (TIGR00369 family)